MRSVLRILAACTLGSVAACGGFLGLGSDDATPATATDASDAGSDVTTSSGESDGSATGAGDSGVIADATNEDAPAPPPCLASSCPKQVFVTKATFTGDLGGVVGADSKCQEAGDKLIAGRQWKAWISTTNSSVEKRHASHSGEYVTGNSVVVAFGWAAFASATHATRIMDETGQALDEDAWTGTHPNGEAIGAGFDCNEWMSADAKDDAVVGRTGSTDQSWSNGGTLDCSNLAHLYCIEQ